MRLSCWYDLPLFARLVIFGFQVCTLNASVVVGFLSMQGSGNQCCGWPVTHVRFITYICSFLKQLMRRESPMYSQRITKALDHRTRRAPRFRNPRATRIGAALYTYSEPALRPSEQNMVVHNTRIEQTATSAFLLASDRGTIKILFAPTKQRTMAGRIQPCVMSLSKPFPYGHDFQEIKDCCDLTALSKISYNQAKG